MSGEPQIVKALRRAGAHDGRSASVRIDRVESMVGWMATTLVRALGPDKLLDSLGREQALAVLELAGQDTGRIEARWNAEQAERESRAPKQVSVRHTHTDEAGEDWRYDDRVRDALTLPDDDYYRVVREVQAEYAKRAKRKAEADAASPVARNLMWIGTDGRPRYGDQVAMPLGAPTDSTGAPTSRALSTNTSLPELGSEPVGPTPMSDIRVTPLSSRALSTPARRESATASRAGGRGRWCHERR